MFNIHQVLGIEYPIIQGGMAYTSKAELAAAVSNAGGLGLVATGGFTPQQVREEIQKMRRMTRRPFGVNIVLIHPQVEELVELVVEEDISIITCGAGNPAPYFERWKSAGIKVIPVIANVKMAKKCEALGATAVVFEGAEGGGHIGGLHTMAELPAVCRSVSIPVCSAGGIYTGVQMAAAEIMGAAGVQIGTRFLVGEETPVSEAYKRRLIEAKDSDSVVTGRIYGHAVRVVKNQLTDAMTELEKKAAPLSEFEQLGVGAYRKGVNGDVEWGSVMAGEGLAYLDKIEPIGQIVRNLMEEYEEAKRNYSS